MGRSKNVENSHHVFCYVISHADKNNLKVEDKG